jgi:hypothetical protein
MFKGRTSQNTESSKPIFQKYLGHLSKGSFVATCDSSVTVVVTDDVDTTFQAIQSGSLPENGTLLRVAI